MARVALVTGCGSGIGHAITRALLADGWQVHAGGRDDASLDALAALGAQPQPLDVCDDAACEATVGRVLETAGHIDALVNNAGYGLHGALECTDLAAARRQLETNFFGAAHLCQLVLPGMRAQRSGTILNMSSMGGRITFPGGAFYHASKHALEALSDALRFEVAGFGIRVVLVEPGPVASGFGRTGIDTLGSGEDPPAYQSLHESIRAGLRSTFEGPGSELSSTPDEVAHVCLEVLNDEAPAPRYVVGEMAHNLIAQRTREGDEAWDGFLEGLYARPGSEPSGKTRSS